MGEPTEFGVVHHFPLVERFRGSWASEVTFTSEEWLIFGMVPAASYALLIGRRGSAKSFLALDIAFRGACGSNFFGQKCETFGTIYFVGEKKGRFGKRVQAWIKASGKADPAVMIVDKVPNVLLEQDVDDVIAFIERQKPFFEARGVPLRMVIFDTLVRSIGGQSDSDFEVAGVATEAFQRIVDQTGVTVMPLHHMAKSMDQTTGRGAGVWEDAADSIIRIDRKPGEDIRTITLSKQSDEADGLEFAFGLEVVEVGEDDRGRVVSSCIIRKTAVPDPAGFGLTKAPRLSPAATMIMSAFNRLMGDGPKHPAPLVPGVHRGMQAVTPDDLRQKAYDIGLGGPPPEETADAKAKSKFSDNRRKAFTNGLEAAIAAGLLRTEKGFIWDPKTKSGVAQ
jgi:hypothetical protein